MAGRKKGGSIKEQIQRKLIEACRHGEVDKIDDLLNRGGKACVLVNDCTALHYAAEHESTDILKKLLATVREDEIDVNETSSGITPLHRACKKADAETVECVKLLIQAGASITRKDTSGYTALHFATRKKTTNVLQAMFPLKEARDVNIKSGFGTTPLLNACHYGTIECVRLLIENGARKTDKDKKNHNAIHCSVWNKDPIQILKECLTWTELDFDGLGECNRTPLIEACLAEPINEDVVRLLLDSGADATIKDSEGRQAEDYVRGRNRSVLALLRNEALKNNQQRKSSSAALTSQMSGGDYAPNTDIHDLFWDSETMKEYSEAMAQAMADFSRNWIRTRLQQKSHNSRRVRAASSTSVPEMQNEDLPSTSPTHEIASELPSTTSNEEDAATAHDK